MNDGKVSVTTTLAWTCWALAGLFFGAAWAASGEVHATTRGMALCTLSIMFAAAAATLHTRSFFCAFLGRIIDAYEMGRDHGRAEEQERVAVPLQRVR